MAEEFGGGVCGGNWWNPSRNICSSPRSSLNNHFESLSNWQMMNYEAEMMKLRSCKEIAGSNPSRVCGTALYSSNNLPILAPELSIWNQDSLRISADECLLQENMDSCQFQDPGIGDDDDSSMKGFKQINQELSDLDQSGTASCTSTIVSCQGLPTSTTFPIGSSDSSQFRCSQMMQSLPGLPVVNAQSTSPSLKPSFPFNHITPYWNPSTDAPLRDDDIGASLFASSHPNFTTSTFKRSNGDLEDSTCLFSEASSEPVYKRPRIETPSSLPTFNVRKEKLGDRVTALQQLVSPFGKTDTASVLNEAVDYIKFLHDHVSGLITSHMKNGASMQHQQAHHNGLKIGQDTHKKDLSSQGLCLVPISKTYAVANDITADSQFWALPLGGTFG